MHTVPLPVTRFPFGSQAWKEILIGASDDPEEQYLLKLLSNASKALEGPFKGETVANAEQIIDDRHAVAILDRICAIVVTNKSEAADGSTGAGSAPLSELHFMHDCNGMWAGADFGLLLAMLLVNRTGLVHLFFAREGRRDASSMMPNALWACLLCRQLSLHSDVGVCSYHLKNGFEVRAPSPPHPRIRLGFAPQARASLARQP
jgi:hypothetical protein